MSGQKPGEIQKRTIEAKFETREDVETNKKYIDAYFSVFNSEYEMTPYDSEMIDPHAFDGTLNGDIRCLTNHDSTLVLGRTTAGTFRVNTDEHGLHGVCEINEDDRDALNLYARVKRGDVNQCSIGFFIIREEMKEGNDGKIVWLVKEAELIECSVVTFPAYEDTTASARSKERTKESLKRKNEAFKENMKKRLDKLGTQEVI